MPVLSAVDRISSAAAACSFVMDTSFFSTSANALTRAAMPPTSARDFASREIMPFMLFCMPSGRSIPNFPATPFSMSPRPRPVSSELFMVPFSSPSSRSVLSISFSSFAAEASALFSWICQFWVRRSPSP